ncbi:MAG: PEP-CTERM sorting domain-containing protein [Burkholderiales bacterium]
MLQVVQSLVFVCGVVCSLHAAAFSVLFSATDIPDATSTDRWLYRYELSGVIAFDDSVRIDFDAAVHSPESVATMAPGWFIDINPSQVTPFPANGHVLFSPVSPPAALPQVFDVIVVRTAPGPVLPQRFELLDANFDTRETGITSPVPEPGAWALGLVGVGLVAVRIAARRRTPRH